MRATFMVAFAALLAVSAAQAQSSVRVRSSVLVDESNLRVTLKNNSSIVIVPIENTTDHIIRADLSLTWLSSDDLEQGSANQAVTIPLGNTNVEAPLPIQTSSIWSRLRYILTPDRADARAFAPIRGILALPHIADHVFEVKVSHVGMMRPGDSISIYAQAVHPLTRVPISNAEWTGTLKVGDGTLKPKAVIAHGGGITEFTFDPPTFDRDSDDPPFDDAEAEISAKLGDFSATVSESIRLDEHWSAKLQSDKPIYQPGQTLHVRAVILDPHGHAIPDAKVNLHVNDQDRQRIHTAQLVSSKFGVVQDDWQIPESIDLGGLQIELMRDGDDNYRIATHVVRLSRYELPTFSVTATPDRQAYLPEQQPRITISGMYLFGKPVRNGHVKIVRREDHDFGIRDRSTASKEKVVAEGDAGTDGNFSAVLDLKSDHEDLKDSRHKLFEDVHFAAYYKDPSSGRTEQRKFDIRVTRDAVHIYTIRTNQDSSLGESVYISTSYADGRPASAAVNIVFRGKRVSLQTNRYGIGKVMLPKSGEAEDEDATDGPEIWATDSTGQTGHRKESYWSNGFEVLQLDTGHTLHRTGESVTLRLTSDAEDAADQPILIHALVGDKRIATRFVQMTNHKAEVTFPLSAGIPEHRGFRGLECHRTAN